MSLIEDITTALKSHKYRAIMIFTPRSCGRRVLIRELEKEFGPIVDARTLLEKNQKEQPNLMMDSYTSKDFKCENVKKDFSTDI